MNIEWRSIYLENWPPRIGNLHAIKCHLSASLAFWACHAQLSLQLLFSHHWGGDLLNGSFPPRTLTWLMRAPLQITAYVAPTTTCIKGFCLIGKAEPLYQHNPTPDPTFSRLHVRSFWRIKIGGRTRDQSKLEQDAKCRGKMLPHRESN